MEQETNIDRFKRFARERIEEERQSKKNGGILDYSIQITSDDPVVTSVSVQLHLDPQWNFGNFFFEDLSKALGSNYWSLSMDKHQLYVKFVTEIPRHRYGTKQ